MDWALSYYTQQSETFARDEITETHRAIARRLHGWCAEGEGCRRVLELGAGAGGVAASLADLGCDVTAVEFNPADAAHARRHASTPRAGRLTVVEEDFYTVRFDAPFDFVYYWDGFGIGTDAEQRRLIARIGREWLAPHGRAILDVFSPWNWLRQSGEVSEYTARDGRPWRRLVEFDAIGNRLVDRWSPVDGGEPSRSQTIRCYSIPDLVLVLEGTGLRLDGVLGMDGREIDPTTWSEPVNEMLLTTNGYIARLAPADDRG